MMRKRKQRLDLSPVETQIEKLSHDGRGIARIQGKTTFIEGALPHEVITFQYTSKKSDFDEGKLINVLQSSEDRVDPKCAHYSMCGGCSFQHLSSDNQILQKQQILLDLFARVGHCKPSEELPALTDQVWHYRNKARLSVRYVEKKQATLVGFREKLNGRYITEIQDCPVLTERVSIQRLRELVNSFDDPRIIAQVEVAAGDEEIALIFRNLSSLTANDEYQIKQFAEETQTRIFLQPEGADSVYAFYPLSSDDYLSYSLPEFAINFKFHPTDFTQINAGLNRLMVKRALELMKLNSSDAVLDLFCGLGNFSLPMAKFCSRVVGIEGSARMVERARMNAQLNSLDNTAFYAANLDDEAALTMLQQHACNKILLDPPRTGAATIVQNMYKLNPELILYVSCNPITLARDANVLVNQHGYHLQAAGVMDMFPHTAHVESMAVFVRS